MTSLKDEVFAAHVKHLENCYLIRDTIGHDKKTQLLWSLLKHLLVIREAEVLTDMRRTTKSQAHKGPEGETLGYTQVPMTSEDFHNLAGFSEGLRYMDEKVEEMINKANTEDRKKDDA